MVEWSSLVNNKTVVVAATAAAAAAIVAVVLMSKRKKREYELVGEVSALINYPIKSCRGISSDVAFCTFSGIRLCNSMDRHLVIVRANGDFITQRQISKMAGVRTHVEGQMLVLTAEQMPRLSVNLYPKPDKSKLVPCRVWKSHLEAQDCGEEPSKWLSKYLEEEGLKLLILVPGLKRRQSPTPNAKRKDQVAFPDEAPYLIATEESLADLVSRIPSSPDGKITMANFRPNIVIKGTKAAWDEDNWEHLKIGRYMEMRVLNPCDRCVLTTVNPRTYKRREDEEPLKTLRSFRSFPKVSKSPLFGIFGAVDVENTIRVGDKVYASRK